MAPLIGLALVLTTPPIALTPILTAWLVDLVPNLTAQPIKFSAYFGIAPCVGPVSGDSVAQTAMVYSSILSIILYGVIVQQLCALFLYLCYLLFVMGFPVTAAFAEFQIIRYLFPVNCFGNCRISCVTSAHLLTATVPGCIPLLDLYASSSDSSTSLSSPSVPISSFPLCSFQGRSSGKIGWPSRA